MLSGSVGQLRGWAGGRAAAALPSAPMLWPQWATGRLFARVPCRPIWLRRSRAAAAAAAAPVAAACVIGAGRNCAQTSALGQGPAQLSSVQLSSAQLSSVQPIQSDRSRAHLAEYGLSIGKRAGWFSANYKPAQSIWSRRSQLAAARRGRRSRALEGPACWHRKARRPAGHQSQAAGRAEGCRSRPFLAFPGAASGEWKMVSVSKIRTQLSSPDASSAHRPHTHLSSRLMTQPGRRKHNGPLIRLNSAPLPQLQTLHSARVSATKTVTNQPQVPHPAQAATLGAPPQMERLIKF